MTMTTTWHLTFQQDDLPTSMARADRVPAEPPAGLIAYVELAHGAWTLSPASSPLGIEAIEWPRRCNWIGVTDCPGTLVYVSSIGADTYRSASGEIIDPAGWECDTCGRAEVGGLGAVVTDWESE